MGGRVMTERDIRLENYGWTVRCFLGYRREDSVCLCQALSEIGCKDDALRSAYAHFLAGGEDSGLTYSNVRERVSVLAVGYDDDKASMVNTVGHELLHVVAHVCEEYGIDMLSEEPCYIMGRLCEDMYSII